MKKQKGAESERNIEELEYKQHKKQSFSDSLERTVAPAQLLYPVKFYPCIQGLDGGS
jgi:hypothetical protein